MIRLKVTLYAGRDVEVQELTKLKKRKEKNIKKINKIYIYNRMTANILKQDPNTKRLFILTRTHSMQIFGEIFVKAQNYT